MLYACGCWPWLYIGRGYIVLEHSTHLVWTRRSSHHAADVIVLWITYSVIDRLDDVYRDIVGIVYLLDVLVVVVHISHSKCWITYHCTRIEVSVLRLGGGVGVSGEGGSF